MPYMFSSMGIHIIQNIYERTELCIVPVLVSVVPLMVVVATGFVVFVIILFTVLVLPPIKYIKMKHKSNEMSALLRNGKLLDKENI